MALRPIGWWLAWSLVASPALGCFHNECDDLYTVRKDCGLTPHDDITLSADSGCEDCADCMLHQTCDALASGTARITCGCPTLHCSSSSPCPSAFTCDIYDPLNGGGTCVPK